MPLTELRSRKLNLRISRKTGSLWKFLVLDGRRRDDFAVNCVLGCVTSYVKLNQLAFHTECLFRFSAQIRIARGLCVIFLN